jgi:hypothetical protein
MKVAKNLLTLLSTTKKITSQLYSSTIQLYSTLPALPALSNFNFKPQ